MSDGKIQPTAFWYCSCRRPKTKVWYAEDVSATPTAMSALAECVRWLPEGTVALEMVRKLFSEDFIEDRRVVR